MRAMPLLLLVVVQGIADIPWEQHLDRILKGHEKQSPSIKQTMALIEQWGTLSNDTFLTKIPVGVSTLDNPIWMFGVTRNPQHTVQNMKSQPGILMNSLLHPQERNSLIILLFILSKMMLSPSALEVYLLERQTLWLIPFPNIDSTLEIESHQRATNKHTSNMDLRKNRHFNNQDKCGQPESNGVDLNRNFDFHFSELGKKNPCHEEYPGLFPFSERETQVFQQIVADYNIHLVLDFHSYGNNFVYPYAFDRTEHLLSQDPVSLEYYQQVIRSTKSLRGSIDTSYNYLGYVADGVYIDWAASKGIHAFAYEFGVGFQDNITQLKYSVNRSRGPILDLLVKNAFFLIAKGKQISGDLVVELKSFASSEMTIRITNTLTNSSGETTTRQPKSILVPAEGRVELVLEGKSEQLVVEVMGLNSWLRVIIPIERDTSTGVSAVLLLWVLSASCILMLLICCCCRRVKPTYDSVTSETGSFVV